THHLAALAFRVAALLWLLIVPKIHPVTERLSVVGVSLVEILALGLFWSERLATGLDTWATAALSVALLWTATRMDEAPLEHTLDGVTLAATAHALWALGQWCVGTGRPSAGFFNPNYLAAWLVLAIAWCAVRGGRSRLALVPVLALAVLASASRSALLALLVLGVLACARRSWKWALVFATATPIVALLVPSVRARIVGVGDAFAFDRMQIWSSAWRAGLRAPWGWGLGDASIAFRQVGVPLEHGWVRFPKTAYHAHNEVLQLWVELGLLGVVALLLAAILAASMLQGRQESRWNTGMVLAAITVPMLLSASLRVPVIAASAALMLGARARHVPLPTGFSRPWVAHASVALAAAAVLVTLPASAGRVFSEFAAGARAEGRLADAQSWSYTASTVAPFSVSAQLLRASVRFAATKDTEHALAELLDLSERFPGAPEPPERAERLLKTVPDNEARRALAVELAAIRTAREPNNALRWVTLALAHETNGDARLALESLERAIALEPNCASALAFLALASPPKSQTQLDYARRALRAASRAKHHHAHSAEVLRLSDRLHAEMRTLLGSPLDSPIRPLKWGMR
ncbi:MAG: O-antigen ligase family protein, partial [Myxococcota bacterium]